MKMFCSYEDTTQTQESPGPVELTCKAKEIVTIILCGLERRKIKILKEGRVFSGGEEGWFACLLSKELTPMLQ